MTLSLRYAAGSDVGLLRKGNEDSGYAGPHLLAVADGMGGHAHGEVASASVIGTLSRLDADLPSAELVADLSDAMREANHQLRGMVEADPALEGMGTTLTALLFSTDRLCLGHIGDSRAYLVRDGVFRQVTRDHSLVQSLIDEGKITVEQAAVHPQRSLLLRAMGGHGDVEPDVSLQEARLDDRWLLCSDGLFGYVSEETIEETVGGSDDLDAIVHRLIQLANRAGGPDNITCVVADVVDTTTHSDHPLVVGAATERRTTASVAEDTPARRAAVLTAEPPTQPIRTGHLAAPAPPGRGTGRSDHDLDDDGDDLDDDGAAYRRPRRWPRVVWPLVLVLVLVAAAFAGWRWTMGQYYVGPADQNVALYRGIAQPVGPLRLNRVEQRTSIRVADLPAYDRERVRGTIEVAGRDEGEATLSRLDREARRCAELRDRSQHPAPRPSGTGRSGSKPTTKPGGKPRHRQKGAASRNPSATPSSTPSPTRTPDVSGCPR